MRSRLVITGVVCVLAAFAGASLASGAGHATVGAASSLRGEGSSFVFPLLSRWIEPLARASVDLDYEPTGSGEGVAAVIARQVDFGATDAPRTASQRAACDRCLQIPWALSATAAAYNAPGVRSGLRLSGPVIAQIFLGKVKRWNAPAIRGLNQGVPLPDLAITPVQRSDVSGTTFSLSQYLPRSARPPARGSAWARCSAGPSASRLRAAPA